MLKETATAAKILTPIALLGFFLILFFIDPFEAGILALALFLISLGIFLWGALILWDFVQQKKKKKEINPVYLRRSGLGVLLFLLLLWLKAMDALFWWNFLFFLLLVIAWEFYLTVRTE